ncbi:tetratricopeptide (TPR) repeat protein [Paenibacillus turicensis]|uniref:Tetratricopeptide (TPR) repeat protein n=1 Tax=Paenibacillus turicensis TaxID=160487 RepID=A0ABS4FW86_9BACL|nr:J domain-containing protein [Paenibacillus turicensis]MBP1906848.1 tetratricopeptide (TPR) repeat protein [Paenibacillus turicensis]
MLNKWERLGIEPTSDVKLIKRAYASKLKMYHPEDDPQGYQALREAYEWAMKQSQLHSNTVELEEQPKPSEQVKPPIKQPTHNKQNHIPPKLVLDFNRTQNFATPDEVVAAFIQKVANLYDDFSRRIDESCWLVLLQDKVMWNISVSEKLFKEISYFLNEYCYLPIEIWDILNQSFDWTGTYYKNPNDFEVRYPQIYKRVIQRSPECLFNYVELLQAEELDYDSYLAKREVACSALLNHELEDARAALIAAQKQFAEDPALIHLICTYCTMTGDLQWGREISQQGAVKYPDIQDMWLHRAYFDYYCHEAKEALQAIEPILRCTPDHTGALALALQCHLELGQLDQAEQICELMLSRVPNDIEAITGLAIISERRFQALPKGNRKERMQLLRLLGMGMTFQQRVLGLIKGLKLAWLVIIAAVFLQSFIYVEVKNELGMSPWEYIRSNDDVRHHVQPVGNTAELKQAFEQNQTARLELSQVKYIGLNRVYQGDMEKFVDADEKTKEQVNQNELPKSGVGYVFIGYVGNESILVITNNINNTSNVKIVGRPKLLVSSILNKAFAAWASLGYGEKRNASYVLDHPVSEFYIDTQADLLGNVKQLAYKWSPYIVILVLMYWFIFNQIRNLWRWLRYV